MKKIQKKVVKDKWGDLAPEPTFKPTPTFYKIADSRSFSFQEGECWEFEIVSSQKTPVKDKRGRDIYIDEVVPVKRVENINKGEIKFDGCFSFIVPVYSGDVLVRRDNIPARRKVMLVDKESPNGRLYLVAEAEREVKLPTYSFTPRETLEEIRIIDILNGARPEWVPEEYINLLEAEVEKRKKEEQGKKDLLEKDLQESPLDIKDMKGDMLFRHFLLHGGKVLNPQPVDPTMHLWGQDFSVFEIGGARFCFEFANYDNCEIACVRGKTGRVKDEKTINQLFQLARFIANPKVDKAPYKLFVSAPDTKVIFKKEVPIVFTFGRFSKPGAETITIMNENENEIEEMKALQAEVEAFISNFQMPNVIEKNLYGVYKVAYTPELKVRIEKENDIEEGVGHKDDTYWANKKLVAEVILEWKEEVVKIEN